MNRRQLIETYRRAEKGNKQAQRKITDYLQKKAYNANRRLSNIRKQGLTTQALERTEYYLQSTDIDVFPTTYRKLEATGLGERTLKELISFNRNVSSVRAIKSYNRKVIERVRNAGWNIPEGKEDFFIRLINTDAFKAYNNFGSDFGQDFAEGMMKANIEIEQIEDIWNEYLQSQAKDKDLFDFYSEWVEI